MALERLDIDGTLTAPLPGNVRSFLEGSMRRIDGYLERHRRTPYMGFFPSDYEAVCGVLMAVRDLQREPGRLCEWGSGFAVVAGLGKLLGFDACGIEIDPRLVKESRELLAEYRLDVEVQEGSFVPTDFQWPYELFDPSWHTIYGSDVRGDVDVDVDDFEVIFAYPWPGEEQIYFDVFERYAALGAFFVTYQGLEGVFVHRKMPD